MTREKVLITGAHGYIGSKLGMSANDHGYYVLGTTRSARQQMSVDGYETVKAVGSINGSTDWSDVLVGIDYVVHLAGCAHKTGVDSQTLTQEYTIVNRDATLRLAEQAAEIGVKRFVYISTIGVLGDSSGSSAFNNKSIYNPKNAYAYSKMEAEESLVLLSMKYKMEIVILRPPLVYGPGAPGNLERLIKLCSFSRVLPFGDLVAQKSMVSLANLCDLIVHCLHARLESINIFTVSDDSIWSTKDLVSLIAIFLNVRVFNIPVPVRVLKFLAMLVGKSGDVNKLANNLRIDNSNTKEVLNWAPSQEPIIGLKQAVEYFKYKN